MNKGIALLRTNYRRLSEDQPYGTPHSCYQLSKAIAESGRYSFTDIYDEGLNFAGLSYPFNGPGQFRRLDEMSLYLDDYSCVYLSNDLMTYVSQNLRLSHQKVPLIAEIGTAHFDDQWKNIFIAAITGNIAAYDGFIFKSSSSQKFFETTLQSWATQFGIHAAPQMRFIPNGIDTQENQRSESARKECRDFLLYDAEDVVFLAFNRIAPTTKLDYESLVLNWRHVVRQNKNAKLLIAGAKVSQPDYRDYPLFLRNLARKAGISSHVTILENPYEIFGSARNALMSASDVFVHTSKGIQETTSLTILEAMSHELPVIVSDWAGGRDLITEHQEGFLVRTTSSDVPMDVEANYFSRSSPFYNGAVEESAACHAEDVIKAAVALSTNHDLRQKMAKAARNTATAKHTLEGVTASRIDFFEKCSKLAESAASSAPSRDKKIIDTNIILKDMSGSSLTPASRLSLGKVDDEWLRYERWAQHSDLSLQILDTLSTQDHLTAGEIFLRLFGKECSTVSGEWPVFSAILIKLLAINLLRCEP